MLKLKISESLLKKTYDQQAKAVALKKELKSLEASLSKDETEIMAMLQRGAGVPIGWAAIIKSTERKCPSWKTLFISIAGEDAAAMAINDTPPSIAFTLLIAATGEQTEIEAA